jgi:hypothetical protein
MEASTTTRLSDIVAALDAHVRDVRRLGLKQTALLLDMAKLDLQMRIHGITDVELDELCKAVERHGDDVPNASPTASPAVNESSGTVISLFGGDRFSTNDRPTPGRQGTKPPQRAERRARGKTVGPR